MLATMVNPRETSLATAVAATGAAASDSARCGAGEEGGAKPVQIHIQNYRQGVLALSKLNELAKLTAERRGVTGEERTAAVQALSDKTGKYCGNTSGIIKKISFCTSLRSIKSASPKAPRKNGGLTSGKPDFSHFRLWSWTTV